MTLFQWSRLVSTSVRETSARKSSAEGHWCWITTWPGSQFQRERKRVFMFNLDIKTETTLCCDLSTWHQRMEKLTAPTFCLSNRIKDDWFDWSSWSSLHNDEGISAHKICAGAYWKEPILPNLTWKWLESWAVCVQCGSDRSMWTVKAPCLGPIGRCTSNGRRALLKWRLMTSDGNPKMASLL